MDVNDLGGTSAPIEISKDTPQSARAKDPSLSATPASAQPAEEVEIQITDSTQFQTSDVRGRANQVINLVNVATTATDDIQKLVESIGGIVEQAQAPDLSDSRMAILEKEANQLVDEIRAKAQTTESGGIKPLLGDSVRFEVEERFGDALEIILPDTARNAFGLGQISLSLKDTIIDTITRVEQAKQQFEELRSSVDKAGVSVRRVVDTFEVALQNSEASKISIRSLDQALSLATNAHQQIGKNPDQALGSFAGLERNSAVLLQS